MASRRTAALAVTVLTAGLTASFTGLTLSSSAQAAADATPGYSLHHITVATKVGPNGGTACTVDADLYIPDGSSSTHRKPSILSTNGFGGRKDDSNESAVGRGFVKAGYVVLTYTGLGFGNSNCKITLDDPAYDGKAGSQMVGVLAGSHSYTEDGTSKRLHIVSQEKPGDPRVGMIGGSYGGEIQYATAMQDKRVDALIPLITWNDLSYSLAPNNSDFSRGVTYKTPGVAKKEWVDLFFGDGIIDGVQDGSVNPVVDLPPCPHFTTQTCQGAVALNSVGYPDPDTLALARHASVSTYMSKIKVPTLLVQGQRDTLFNLQEAAATFHALRAQGTPTRMVWQSWGHSHSEPAPGELDFNAPSLRDSYLGNRFLNWMNHYVRGNSKAPVGPMFSYFRDWVSYSHGANAGTAIRKAYAEQSSFSQKPTVRLYFNTNSELRKAKPKTAVTSQYANAGSAPTSYSETSGLEGDQVNNPPSDAQGTATSFTTPKLAHAVSLVGSSSLTLHLSDPVGQNAQSSGPAGHLVLFAKIYDVAPDGTLTLQNRLISPVRVTDVTKQVNVQLPGVVQQFKAGHQIRVTVAASDAAYGANAVPHAVTISSPPNAPSVLRMPLHGLLTFQ